jgi:hypothetical protein
MDQSQVFPFVVNLDEKEWVQYTVDVVEPRTYMLAFDVQSKGGYATLAVTKDKKTTTVNLPLPDSTEPPAVAIKLVFESGRQTFRVTSDTGSIKIRSITFLPKTVKREFEGLPPTHYYAPKHYRRAGG